jgi:hypothetical protein
VADDLDPVRVLRALARPGVGAGLHALGVRDLSTFGGPNVYVSAEHELRVRHLVVAALAEDRPTDEADLAGGDLRSARGRRRTEVSEDEANKAARIFIANGQLTAYEVWTRYNPKRTKQEENPNLHALGRDEHVDSERIDARKVRRRHGARGADEPSDLGRGRLVLRKRRKRRVLAALRLGGRKRDDHPSAGLRELM